MREGPDFFGNPISCDIKLLAALSYGLIPVTVLILFGSQPTSPIN